MLGNCDEKMLLISSSPPPNEWPQNIINPIDDPESTTVNNNNNNNNNNNMGSLTATATNPTGVVDHHHHHQKVDHQQQQQQQQQQKHQESLKCPRCDSTNTKFCYYNNYSLSQPRHFCKACKRYWTRGGTLRNVPVGGGCRKNKRVKRSTNNSSSSSITTTSLNNSANNNNNINNEGSVNSGTTSSISVNNNGGSIHELISSGSNPLFYGFPASNTMNFPFSRYDLQNPPQINGLGLGFSSGLVHNMSSMHIHQNSNNNNKQIFQELMSSNPLLSHYATTTSTTTGTTTTTTATTTTTPPPPPPTISTLLGSTLHQMNKGGGTLLPSYEGDLHMKGSGNNGMFIKEVKMEFQGANRSFDTNHHWDTTHNQMDQPMGSSNDPSIIWGATNGANLGAWLDPSNNLGSSVPSLI